MTHGEYNMTSIVPPQELHVCIDFKDKSKNFIKKYKPLLLCIVNSHSLLHLFCLYNTLCKWLFNLTTDCKVLHSPFARNQDETLSQCEINKNAIPFFQQKRAACLGKKLSWLKTMSTQASPLMLLIQWGEKVLKLNGKHNQTLFVFCSDISKNCRRLINP